MRRSLSLAAYVAGLRHPASLGAAPAPPPARPDAAVIWARCCHPDQLPAIDVLQRKLAEDADTIQIITTLPDPDPAGPSGALPEPRGKEALRSFLGHLRPILVIWVRGDLDPVLLNAIHAARIPAILVDAAGDDLDRIAGGWVPGAVRSVLSVFDSVLTIDASAARKMIGAGTPQGRVAVTGPMEDCGAVMPYEEADRRSLALAIGTRPVWLAAGTRPEDATALCSAQKTASRRAHRLLLVVVPAEPQDAFGIAGKFRGAGLQVAVRSQSPVPSEAAQVFVIDTDDALGLWYRLAPVTYLGGTLYGGGCRDPFEPAALGSAVIAGPRMAPFQHHAARLAAASALLTVQAADALGPAVETLLAPDKAAMMAHAAWDVTSRGANVTNQIIALIRQRFEESAA